MSDIRHPCGASQDSSHTIRRNGLYLSLQPVPDQLLPSLTVRIEPSPSSTAAPPLSGLSGKRVSISSRHATTTRSKFVIVGIIKEWRFKRSLHEHVEPVSLRWSTAEGAAVSTVTGGTMNKLPNATNQLDTLPPTPDLPHSPNFVVHPNGEAVIVPNGAMGPHPVNTGKGFQFQGGSGGHGLANNTTSVRIMDPVLDGKYPKPNGYVSYSNKADQAVNPYTGQTISKKDPMWHIEFDP